MGWDIVLLIVLTVLVLCIGVVVIVLIVVKSQESVSASDNTTDCNTSFSLLLPTAIASGLFGSSQQNKWVYTFSNNVQRWIDSACTTSEVVLGNCWISIFYSSNDNVTWESLAISPGTTLQWNRKKEYGDVYFSLAQQFYRPTCTQQGPFDVQCIESDLPGCVTTAQLTGGDQPLLNYDVTFTVPQPMDTPQFRIVQSVSTDSSSSASSESSGSESSDSSLTMNTINYIRTATSATQVTFINNTGITNFTSVMFILMQVVDGTGTIVYQQNIGTGFNQGRSTIAVSNNLIVRILATYDTTAGKRSIINADPLVVDGTSDICNVTINNTQTSLILCLV